MSDRTLPARRSALRTAVLAGAAALTLLLLHVPVASAARPARKERLALTHLGLELPGAPSTVIPADLDGDGRRDLVVVVAATDWDEIGIMESSEMGNVEGIEGTEGVEGLVEVLTIIPALLERREVRVFRGRAGGGFESAGPALAIDSSVLSLEAGPPGLPVVALTDQGLSALRLRPGVPGEELALEPLVDERPVLAGTGAFVPNLGLVRDLSGDGVADVLVPIADGAAVLLAGPGGLGAAPASRLRIAEDDPEPAPRLVRHVPLPQVRDVTGDGLADLLLPHHRRGWTRFRVLRNLGDGRFAEPVAPLGLADDSDEADEPESDEAPAGPRVVFFGDVDGDGRAEYVTAEAEEAAADASVRQELAHARRPPHVYRFHHMRPDLGMEPKPYHEVRATGYAFGDAGRGGGESSGMGSGLPGGFRDLDGDGRLDLVTITLDFSALQLVKIVAAKRLSLGLDFHVWCQRPDGRFSEVKGLDLSGRFNLNLNNLKLGHLSQFAGDFDGDGRADFVQMGRGKAVTIHKGGPGCTYPAAPDATIELAEPPRDLGLVKVADLDGDGLADLSIIQPQRLPKGADRALSNPVRLDLYLSGGGA